MRKYLMTTLFTSLAGFAWRNRHKVFDRNSEPDQSTNTTAGSYPVGAAA